MSIFWLLINFLILSFQSASGASQLRDPGLEICKEHPDALFCKEVLAGNENSEATKDEPSQRPSNLQDTTALEGNRIRAERVLQQRLHRRSSHPIAPQQGLIDWPSSNAEKNEVTMVKEIPNVKTGSKRTEMAQQKSVTPYRALPQSGSEISRAHSVPLPYEKFKAAKDSVYWAADVPTLQEALSRKSGSETSYAQLGASDMSSLSKARQAPTFYGEANEGDDEAFHQFDRYTNEMGVRQVPRTSDPFSKPGLWEANPANPHNRDHANKWWYHPQSVQADWMNGQLTWGAHWAVPAAGVGGTDGFSALHFPSISKFLGIEDDYD